MIDQISLRLSESPTIIQLGALLSLKPDVNMLADADLIRRLAAKHGAVKVRVFGSVARGEERPDSDLDLLVEVGPEPTPWFPGGLVADLEEALGRRVDVVIESALDPELKDRVLAEAIDV